MQALSYTPKEQAVAAKSVRDSRATSRGSPFFLLPVRMANIAGNEYVYREIGSGQPVLALPGLWTTSLTFRNLIEPLGHSCHLLLPELLDPAGHNLLSDGDYSPEGLAELILRMIEGLGLEKVVLVGHGECGLACLWLALTQPARIHSVLVIASATRLRPWQVLKGYWQGRAQSIYWAKAAFLQPDRAALAMLQYRHQAPGIVLDKKCATWVNVGKHCRER